LKVRASQVELARRKRFPHGDLQRNRRTENVRATQ